MSFTNVLYYPWIDFRNEPWLRGACLYWNKIHTIVPKSLRRPYSSDFAKAMQDEGVLQPLFVESAMPEIQEMEHAVLDYLETPEASVLLNANDDELDDRAQGLHDRGTHHREYHIHSEKMALSLAYRLQETFDSDGEWIDVDQRFADFYMTLLASKLAEAKGFGLLSASLQPERMIARAQSGSTIVNANAMEGTVIELILSDLQIPQDISVKSLVDFRKKHSDELGRFRSKVSDLTGKVGKETTIEAMRQIAADIIENELSPAVSDLRRALNSFGIETFTQGFLKLSLLSTSSSTLMILCGASIPVSLAIGAGVSLVGTAVNYKRGRNALLSDSPVSYLLGMENQYKKSAR